jgi:hypothetical protein
VQLRDEQRALATDASASRAARFDDLQRELAERASHLREELRVCFTQLSIEASETSVTFDRVRRELEDRIESLEKEE